jgi:hypothetical protein
VTEQQETEQQQARPPLTLNDIIERGLKLLAQLDDAEGEVDDALGKALDENADSLITKAEAYKAVALILEAEADALEHFVEIYAQRAKRKRQNVERLEKRLYEAMITLGIPRAIGLTGGAAIQKNSTPALIVSVPDSELKARVPAELLRERTELDKAEVTRRLKAGERFDFAELKYGNHLRWK